MRIRRAMLVALAMVALGAVSCGAEGTEDVGTTGADGPTGSSDPAALDDGPTSPGVVGTSTADGCAAATALGVIEVPSMDFDDVDQLPFDETEQQIEQVRGALTGDLLAGWDRLVEFADLAYEPDAVTPELEAEASELVVAVTLGLAELCVEQGPFWSCPGRQQFEPVGKSFSPVGEIDEASKPTGPPESSDPQALVDEVDQAGEVVVLRDEGTRLYVWLDEPGVVVRSLEVVPVDGGWSRGVDTTCIDPYSLAAAAEEKFETVGEAIEQSNPGS